MQVAERLAYVLARRKRIGILGARYKHTFGRSLMARILITAFDRYDIWEENASWLALVEFTRELPSSARIVTRRYPVDLPLVRERLAKDLTENFDYALHLGQAPGSAAIRLEAVGINIGGSSAEAADEFRPLVTDGPVAFRSALPLAAWARKLRGAGIPAAVSYHAGTYLCNAILYLSHYLVHQHGLATQSAFMHVPLATTQVTASREELPSLPTSTAAAALQLIVADLAMREPPAAAELA